MIVFLSINDKIKTMEDETPEEKTFKPLFEIMGEEIKGLKNSEAINKLIENKSGYVKNAFVREDIGGIALLLGDNTRGLYHIIQRRKQQNIDINDFLSNLSEVIEKGQFIRTNKKGRYEIFLDGKMAVIEPEITNGQLAFLLTAFKRRKP